MGVRLQCSRCSSVNPADAPFCSSCGERLGKRCASCARLAPADAAFCGGCGASLSAQAPSPDPSGGPFISRLNRRGERRLMTVLSSDLSGYTAMNEVVDPEQVAEVLGQIKQKATLIVQEHGGTVNQFVGDEVLALFGIPTVHEDDPRRAVSAALELHRFVRGLSIELEPQLGRPLKLHTGITTGVLLAQPSGRLDGRYLITGDAMNTAARLRARATEDEILIGATTRQLVAPYFLLDELDPHFERGKAAPVGAFRVKERAAQTSFEVAQRRGLTTYTGRRAELEALEAVLSRTSAGQGSFTAVIGQPGVGKSRLLHEIESRARQRGMRILRGACSAFGSVAPFQPFLQVARGALELVEGLAPGDGVKRVLAAVQQLEDPELEQRLAYLLHLLSIPSPQHALPSSLDGDQLRIELFEVLRSLVIALTRRQPVVLMLEDWHWADAASIAVLRHLAESLQSDPVALLINYRDYYAPDWGPLSPQILRLRPFDPVHTKELAQALLGGGTLPEHLVALLHERTGGNPFFIEEVCRGLTERGLLVASGKGLVLARELTSLDVPDSVQAVVRARLDRLGPAEAEVLSVAAVVGVEVPLRLLERLAPAPARLPRALEQLQASDMIGRAELALEPTYRFHHAIIQEVAYDTLLLSSRRDQHARVGEVIEAMYPGERLADHFEALAHHYGRSERFEKAAAYAEKAGDKAARSYAMEEARQQYDLALEYLKRLPETPVRQREQVDVALKWAEVCLYKPMARQVEVLGACHALALRIGYPEGAVRCGYWIGWIQYALGNQAEAVSSFERILPGARSLGNERLVAQLQLNIGQSYAAATEYRRALEHLEQGLELHEVRTLSRGAGVAYAQGHLGMLFGDQGGFERSYRHLREALSITRAVGRRSLEGSVLTQLALVQSWQGNWDASLRTALQMRADAERMGAPFIIAMSKTVEGFARFHLSGDPGSLALLREAVAWLEENDIRLVLSWNYACLAEALALAGKTDEAGTAARKGLARALTWDRRGEAMAHRALGLAAARAPTPEPQQALEHFEHSIEVARRKESPRDEAISRFRMAELFQETGRAADALAQLELALPRFAEMGMAWYQRQAEALRFSLSGASGARH